MTASHESTNGLRLRTRIALPGASFACTSEASRCGRPADAAKGLSVASEKPTIMHIDRSFTRL